MYKNPKFEELVARLCSVRERIHWKFETESTISWSSGECRLTFFHVGSSFTWNLFDRRNRCILDGTIRVADGIIYGQLELIWDEAQSQFQHHTRELEDMLLALNNLIHSSLKESQ